MVDFKKELERRHKASLQKTKDFGTWAAVTLADAIAHPENIYGYIPALMPLAEFNKARRRAENSKAKAEQKRKTPIQDAAKARRSASSLMTTNNVTPTQRPQSNISRMQPTANRADMQAMIAKIAREEGVDPALALSIAHIETGGTFDPNALGDNGNSRGLFQIHGPSHPDYKGGFNPEANARYGIRLFKRLLDANNGSVNKAIWAYNAGQTNVNKGILPSTTKDYINKMSVLGPQYRQQLPSSDTPKLRPENYRVPTGVGGTNIVDPRVIQQPVGQVQQVQAPQAVTSTPQLDSLKLQLQSQLQDPRNNQLDIPTMYNRLTEKYNELQNQIQTQDPRYQGGLIPSQGYYVDPDEAIRRMKMDEVNQRINAIHGLPNNEPSRLDNYLKEQELRYQLNQANQAGVPYADYQAAMLDRQKQMVSARAAQIDSELKMALANEDNVFKRQQLAALIEKNGIDAQNEISKLNYQIQATGAIEQYKAQENRNLERLKNWQTQQNDEIKFKRELARDTYKNKLGIDRDIAKVKANPYPSIGYISAAAGYDPVIARGLIEASGLGRYAFPEMTPEVADKIYGRTPNIPTQSGFLDKLRRYAGLNQGGLQANEQ